MNGLTYAYLGDSFFEYEIRKYLVFKGYNDVNILHNMAIRYTSGVSQALCANYLLENNLLTDDELLIFNQGKNSKVKTTRKIDLSTYLKATALESVIGYLSITNKNRVNDIINMVIKYVEEKDGNR
jgi:ribonuclease-3 family protein